MKVVLSENGLLGGDTKKDSIGVWLLAGWTGSAYPSISASTVDVCQGSALMFTDQ